MVETRDPVHRYHSYDEDRLWAIILRPSLNVTLSAAFSVRLSANYWNLCVSWSGGGTTSYSGMDRRDLMCQAAAHAEDKSWVLEAPRARRHH